MAAVLPWQQSQWEQLIRRRREERLPHALLLSGPAGTGKQGFARALAQACLCDRPEPDGGACGSCRGCTLFAAGSHPDVNWVAPEEEAKNITVDQVRGLIHYLSLKAQYGAQRVVVLTPAEAMNAAAANSLLKTLEEPVAGTLLILVTSRPSDLLPTIRSRCQQLAFPLPDTGRARQWLSAALPAGSDAEALLAFAGGAPLAALALAEEGGMERRAAFLKAMQQLTEGRGEPVALAEAFAKQNAPQVLEWLYYWTADLARLKAAGANARLTNPDMRERLHGLAERLDWAQLHRYQERVAEARGLVRGQINVQLLLEALFVGWVRLQPRLR